MTTQPRESYPEALLRAHVVMTGIYHAQSHGYKDTRSQTRLPDEPIVREIGETFDRSALSVAEDICLYAEQMRSPYVPGPVWIPTEESEYPDLRLQYELALLRRGQEQTGSSAP